MAEAAPVVADDAVVFREDRDLLVPHPAIHEAGVGQDECRAFTDDLVGEVGPFDVCGTCCQASCFYHLNSSVILGSEDNETIAAWTA